jgi:hypothetical protein
MPDLIRHPVVRLYWIPAFAGMTENEFDAADARYSILIPAVLTIRAFCASSARICSAYRAGAPPTGSNPMMESFGCNMEGRRP